MTDQQLEKYTLLEEVGQGGMAVVYRAMDTALNREVAVKILHPHLADQEESRQRFQREAQAVAKLRHDNILEIYDYSGIDSEASFIVTEFIHGQTLRAFLARRPISHPEIAAMIIVEVCRAVGHAHSLHIIHRDIKPENIMIRRDGRVKLTDFGIAQMVDVQRLTVTGQLLGSPAYMAPELVQGKPLDFRADIFSCGTLLYQLATGQLPFSGKNPHEVLKRIAEARMTPAEVVNPLVGDRLGQIIARALARDPADRYKDVGELERALERFLADAEIEDSRQELAAYFADPTDYSQKLQVRVVSALTARGRAAYGEGRTPDALRYFDRVLSADPRNAEVLALLGRISRKRRIGQVVAGLLALALLVGGYAVVASLWPEKPATAGAMLDARLGPDLRRLASIAESSPVSSVPADLGPSAPRDLGRAEATPAAPPTPATRASTRPRRPALRGRPTRMPASRRRIEIIPTPKAVTIWLNERKLGPYGPDLRYVNLPAGKVRMTFRNDACCFTKVVTIAAGTVPPEVMHVKLPWKPGRVRVTVRPPEVAADVVVGTTVGRAGQVFEVPIPSYSDNGRTRGEVKVSAEGYATEQRRVAVRANTTTNLVVELKRLP